MGQSFVFNPVITITLFISFYKFCYLDTSSVVIK